jgi:DNA replication protein DnaD
LLKLFQSNRVRDIDELKALIFLLNYYYLLKSGKRFFDYRFFKNENSIDISNINKDIEELILSGLVKYENLGHFRLSKFGEKILNKFDYDFSEFITILNQLIEINYNEKVSDFVLFKKAKNQEEIEI